MFVSKEQICLARKANLADFLQQEYPADVKIVGRSLCLKNNHSLSINRSFPGYNDFATGEHGNSIDFLIRYLNYSFTDAVNTLCRFSGTGQAMLPAEESSFVLPPSAEPPFGTVTAYLTGRGLPIETVQYLIQENLLYQDIPHGNAVFVSADRIYCEIRGTGSKTFHGCRKRRTDAFWYLLTEPNPETAFICEAAIDAVSLMLLHKIQGYSTPAVYVSIGGVSNQRTIDRICRKMPVVLAVDNDDAGNDCRKNNPELPTLIPSGKDWNDDLQHLYSS